jgi:hypothetical protein
MSFGLSITFNVVWWFYFYFIWSIFNILITSTGKFLVRKVNSKLLIFYFLSVLIFIFHHFFGKEFYQLSTNDSFNILWWSTFGALLLVQIIQARVNYELFFTYVSKIVFLGCIISAALGILKYINILSGNLSSSYFYEEKLLLGSSLSTDYNVYSLGLSIGVLLSVGLYKNITKQYVKYLYILAISLIILSILISGSRRGILMSFFVIYCLFYSNKITIARKQMALISTIFIPIIILFLISSNWDNVSEYLLSSGLLDQSITRVLTLKDELQSENGRTTRFSWSVDYFSDRSGFDQIFGSGFEYLKLMGISFSGELEDNPHNYLLSALIYGGGIGFFLIILLSYILISSSFHHHRAWYPVVLIVLLFGLTSSNSLFSLRIFPTLVFMMSYVLTKKMQVRSNIGD